MPIFRMLVGNVVRALASLTLGAAALAASAQTVTYFHNDPSGSPLMATDAEGVVLWKENYRPYGSKYNNAAGSNANAIGFAGRPYDASSGLSYMDARYYDPVLGRFLGVDPAPVNPESVHGINRYAYANNNPARYVDPDGHTPLDVAFLVWDLGKLSLAVYSGNPAAIAEAATDVAMSVVGVASPIPGTGQAMKAARAAEHAVEAVRVADRAVDAAKATKAVAESGRAGKQSRLRELANDDKLGSADRGWIQQEINSIDRGQRSSIRNPPGKDLAHERGREAAKGYDYKHSNLQDRDLHRLQHKYDDFGRANRERPVN